MNMVNNQQWDMIIKDMRFYVRLLDVRVKLSFDYVVRNKIWFIFYLK